MGWTLSRVFPFLSGTALTLNFLLFWSLPIAGMGSAWKSFFKQYLLPIYDWLDTNPRFRSFAENYIYTKKEHADFFAISLLVIVNSGISLGAVFYWQLTTSTLPYWLIACYYMSWVGVGGRIMGAAYALAHKEGHSHTLYKKPIRETIGNFFENWLGLMFGNVPHNFTTSHVFIHHRVNGGFGDTFYEWDIDRSSFGEFMLYVHRVFLHLLGFTSLKIFKSNGKKRQADMLQRGIVIYWSVALLLVIVTRSVSFMFWIYLQPLFCMTFFLALMNIGFHGFIEFDENGHHIPCVNATTIIEGDDDYFGEDDHMAHHYNSNVYFRDLAEHQKTKIEEFKAHKASVFRGLSIVELSIFILFGMWDKLADHYVDYTGCMKKDEIKQMLKTRAQRREMLYEDYEVFLSRPADVLTPKKE